MDTLDYQAAFVAGLKVKIIFEDGSSIYAKSEEEIANLDGIAKFEID